MVGSIGGDNRSLGAPTTIIRNVDGGPPGKCQDSGAPTTIIRDVDGGPPGR
jgi:hypothetical protein